MISLIVRPFQIGICHFDTSDSKFDSFFLEDEGDNFLIELAVAGNSKYIVTNNIKDLCGAELKFPELNIITPKHFLSGDWNGNTNNSHT